MDGCFKGSPIDFPGLGIAIILIVEGPGSSRPLFGRDLSFPRFRCLMLHRGFCLCNNVDYVIHQDKAEMSVPVRSERVDQSPRANKIKIPGAFILAKDALATYFKFICYCEALICNLECKHIFEGYQEMPATVGDISRICHPKVKTSDI